MTYRVVENQDLHYQYDLQIRWHFSQAKGFWKIEIFKRMKSDDEVSILLGCEAGVLERES
jgi:hypothetical protein